MQLKLPSVPAYSFPKSGRDRWGKELLPGPGQYDNKIEESSSHLRLPRAVMNRAGLKPAHGEGGGPGPAEYDAARSSLSKRGQYIMTSAKRDFNLGGDAGPGPGAYETSVSSLNRRVDAVAKSGRGLHGADASPGPGTYETSISSLKKNGVARMPKSGRDYNLAQSGLPGPLDYDPYSYEERSRFKGGIKIPASGRIGSNTDLTPGPGNYETNLSSLNKHGYAAAKSGRNIFEKDQVPGPGNYETSISSLSKRGIAKLGSSTDRGMGGSGGPGPSDYDPYQGGKEGWNRGLTIPKSGRHDHGVDGTPGPAAYDSHIALDHLQKRIGSRFAPTKANATGKLDSSPGPADYDTARTSLSKRGQAVLPKSGRDGGNKDPTPGPADYDSGKIFEKDWKRGVTIPHAGKNGKTDGTPGPGQYDFIPSVPDVAPYLIPHHVSKA